jgi:hypothetical protein
VKAVEIQPPKSAPVEEDFLPFRRLDEAEPSISNNPLDGSLHHAPRTHPTGAFLPLRQRPDGLETRPHAGGLYQQRGVFVKSKKAPEHKL